MGKNIESANSHRDVQAAAVLFGVTIVGGFLLYWAVQLQSVREMLALAYGG